MVRKTAIRSSSGLIRALRDVFVMSKPASHKVRAPLLPSWKVGHGHHGSSSYPISMLQVLEKALAVELEGLQKIHVAVAKQITRLQMCLSLILDHQT